jgi:hypothetical protein
MTPKRRKYLLFNSCWGLLSISIILWGDKSPIEFASSVASHIFFAIICYSLPVSILWLANTILKIRNPSETIVAITKTLMVLFSLGSLFILLIVGFANVMCSTIEEPLFKSKSDPSVKIVRRYYGCGAVDSQAPNYTFHKIVPCAFLFTHVTTFDITKLDKTAWLSEENVNAACIQAKVEDEAYLQETIEKAVRDKAASEKCALEAKNKRMNLSLLYDSDWLKFDTAYAGRCCDIRRLLEDTARLRAKATDHRKRGMCDGGCVFGYRFKRSGMLEIRDDDTGAMYSVLIDSSNSLITAYYKPRCAPADTVWKMEVTYLDDKYFLGYYYWAKLAVKKCTCLFKRAKGSVFH